MIKKNKLIILSGGMDSATLLYAFSKEIAIAIGFRYGQKHEKEIEYAFRLAFGLGIYFIELDLREIGYCLKSALLQGQGEIPNGSGKRT